MKIELSNGSAEIKDFVSRKAQREYQMELMADAKIGIDGKLEVKPVQMFTATDKLVENMIVKLDEELDDLNSKDFNKIAKACTDMMNEEEESKKK